MTDKPRTPEQEPAPRPPRRPDLALITYLERGNDIGEKAEEPEVPESQ